LAVVLALLVAVVGKAKVLVSMVVVMAFSLDVQVNA
jgi:hypothetical protein